MFTLHHSLLSFSSPPSMSCWAPRGWGLPGQRVLWSPPEASNLAQPPAGAQHLPLVLLPGQWSTVTSWCEDNQGSVCSQERALPRRSGARDLGLLGPCLLPFWRAPCASLLCLLCPSALAPDSVATVGDCMAKAATAQLPGTEQTAQMSQVDSSPERSQEGRSQELEPSRVVPGACEPSRVVPVRASRHPRCSPEQGPAPCEVSPCTLLGSQNN